MTLSLMTIVGARPQFIKAAAVSRRIAADYAGEISETLIHTGQHFDHNMSEIFFEELEIPRPAKNLEIKGGAHGVSTGEMLKAVEAELMSRKPDALMVYGDTNSTLAGALAAAKLHIPVIHVEAGLRSYNKRMPEEINRILTDHVSELLFCPSATSKDILAGEGITKGVHVVGDVMFDVVKYYADKLEPADHGLGENFALMTVHRAENTDAPERMKGILEGVARIKTPVLFPIHPRTKNILKSGDIELPGNIKTVEPLSYLELLAALKASALVLTDSGGLQKEAFYVGKPCVTLRDETEWTELVDLGANRVVGTDPGKIVEASTALISRDLPQGTPYGDGDAAAQTLTAIVNHFR